jgi:bacterioferritin-associated ferredoxin
MIVCQCKGISDSTVRRAVREGAETPTEISLACGAGTDCGCCRPTLVKILESEQSRRAFLPVPDFTTVCENPIP